MRRVRVREWGRIPVLAVMWMAACTEPNPNYDPDAAAALCTNGQRRCGPDGTPQVCTPDDAEHASWKEDFCPKGAVCDQGRCLPPLGASACQRDADCGANVCALFVADGGLSGFCVPATGTQAGGDPCATHADCRSGLCVAPGTSGKVCYAACAVNEDCPRRMECHEISVTVSGIRDTVLGCTLP